MSRKAVILFTNSPSRDASQKFCSASSQVRKCAENLFFSYLKKLTGKLNRAGDFDLLLSTREYKTFENLGIKSEGKLVQSGKTFGERFYQSLRSGFDIGYDKITILGNDTPDLGIRDIKKTFSFSTSNEVVIGPSKDGGFYLFSISKREFENLSPYKFINLPFQTDKICSSLIELLNENCNRLILLNTKNDIDDLKNLLIASRGFKFSTYFFSALVLTMLQYLKNSFSIVDNIVSQSFRFSAFHLKAPPELYKPTSAPKSF